jgi:dolichol-phosphate mannosyltransferase
LGVVVNLAVVMIGRFVGLDFVTAQGIGSMMAMVTNFQLNNEITYREQRLRGFALWRGLLLFMVVCSVGAFANIGISRVMYQSHSNWTAASLFGAAIGVVWNYAVSSTLVWRRL